MKMLNKRRIFWFVLGMMFSLCLVKIFFEVDLKYKGFTWKKDSKKIIYSIKNFFYDKAEKYNPPGDFLPDWIDDVLKGKLKERWMFWRDNKNK